MDKQRRYSLIDAMRAVAVINMILYHLYYDILYFFTDWMTVNATTPLPVWERMICSAFILISGVSLNFSRRGYRRGIILGLCALALTLVTYLFTPDLIIWFGILHFLCVAILLTTALRPLLDKLDPLAGMILSFVLFMLCYGIPSGYIGIFSFPLVSLPEALYRYKWLSVVGFLSKDFYSADYFPVLQWIFLYHFGYHLWRFIKEKQLDRLFYRRIPVLDLIGRHSLLIYMAHQPILYGACYLISLMISA